MSTITLTQPANPFVHAATTPAPRHRMFVAVHKGLRSAMTDALVIVGRTDAEDEAHTAQTLATVRALLDFCRTHLHSENQFIHPAMEARQPGSSRSTADEHLEHERAFETLTADVLAVERSAPHDRASALATLYQRLALFVADNFTHMFEEETHNQSVLWDAYNDAELGALEGAIVASHTPQETMAGLRWMIPALSPAERVRLLNGPRQGMPPEAFDQLLGYCASLLGETDGTRLRAAFCSGPRERACWPR